MGGIVLRYLRFLNNQIEEYFLIIITALMSIVVFYQVFMRYVISSSPSWTAEFARLMFVWMVFIGVSYAIKRQRHIVIDLLPNMLKRNNKTILDIFANIAFLIFVLITVYYGYISSINTFKVGQEMIGLGISKGFMYLALPIGMSLSSIRILQHIWKQASILISSNKADSEVL